MQHNFSFTQSEWVPPHELPNIFDAKVIAFDLETYDPGLKSTGPGWTTKNGHIWTIYGHIWPFKWTAN